MCVDKAARSVRNSASNRHMANGENNLHTVNIQRSLPWGINQELFSST